ncbi:unnamed protein product [Lymnaea stagnalis]|uniref:Tyrosine-protein phosphatase non-receptor type 13 n=1 Tax=Lymnaea stagnalis TaxID=6523 RepID=A0AAV2IC68_LYMST
MPSLTSLPLSLSEILEAQGGPLRELEIWALLCQCAEALQDLIIKGEPVEEAFRHMITPNSLLVRDNGTVVLAEVNQNLHGSLYMAPEFEHTTRQLLSDTAFEKMFVYSLGRTLQVASEFGLKENEVLSISYDLDSLLQAMSERNGAVRLSLMHILEACALQASQHPNKPPHSYTLSKLYKSVLSSNPRRSSHETSTRSSLHTMTVRSCRARKPRPHVRHRHDNQRSWSRSRSRSRSRSHSRERGERDSGILTASYQGSTPPQKSVDQREQSINREAKAINAPALFNIHLLNTSMTSTGSENSEFQPRPFQASAYSAAHSVQGLLGLRQGSPAYQKYIQLKERQIRLRQARTGKQTSILDDVRSRLMTPTLMSYENMTETHSMASLMSYTLGTYKPGLQSQLGSNAALNYSKETDSSSQMSLLLNSGDYGDTLRAEEMPVAVLSFDPTWLNLEMPTQQTVHDVQQEQSARPVLKKQQQQLSPEVAETQELKIKPMPSVIAKPKDYYGPEFIHNDKKPTTRIAMPLQGDSVKNAALARRVTVVHLTGQKLEVILDPSTTGRQLFDTVIPCLELDDFFFFGLTYICEGEHFFMDGDTKLHKVAPEGWKEGPKSHLPPVNFTLYVRVKFYPESLTDFRHTSSYHLLYLQLRKDVIEERLTYNSDTLSRLAGLALQVEYGDYNEAEMGQGYFLAEHYVSFKAIRRFGGSYVEINAIREHKNCKGIAESQAEIEYIKHVRHLPEYGIHFHRLFKNKSNTDSFMWIGLSQHCLVLAEPEVQGRSIIQDYPWNAILKISFNKRRFSIQPKIEVAKGKPPKINFYTNSYRKGRYLLQFSTDQHRFQIRMRTRPSNIETLAGDFSVELVPQTADTGVGDDDIGVDGDDIGVDGDDKVIPPPSYVDPSLQALPDDDDDDLEGDWGGQPMAHSEHPLQYRSPPPYQPPSMALILGGSHVFPELNPLQLHASMTDLTSGAFNEHQLLQLLDLRSESPSLDSALANEKTDYEEPSPPYPKQQFFKSESQIGRLIFEVTLEKEGNHGIGITIVGGETTNSLDLGIFVKSIVPGGPAEKDGRIMPGDRLIAIGGVSLEGKQHHEAVELIRDGGPQITLLVSQIRPPGTIKKRSPHEEHADFKKKLTNSLIEYRSNKNGHNSIYEEKDLFGSSADDFLQFDDFVHRPRTRSSSFSDQFCYSDEENYDLEPPGFGLHPATSASHTLPTYRPLPEYVSNLNSTIHHTKTSPNKLAHDLDNKAVGADNERTDLDELGTVLVNHIDPVSKTHLSRHQIMNTSLHFDNDKPQIPENDTVLKLPGNEELSYKLDFLSNDWSPEGASTAQADFYHGQLTKEEEDALQMLGDIAALDDNDSSSDSDFDTAVKKTIEGPLTKTIVSNKTVNVSNPVIGRGPAEKPFSETQKASDVIYEIILERSDLGFGIVACDIATSDTDNPVNGVYIKNILGGSSAERGGILAPGDKILEIAGKSIEGYTSVQVHDLLNATPDLTTIKVSRPVHRDAVLTSKKDIRDNNQNDLNLQFPYPTHLDLHDIESEQKNHYLQPHQVFEPIHSAPATKERPKAMTLLEIMTSTPNGRFKQERKPDNDPPPVLLLGDSESNTQSDVDSDVLDSSRSELEGIYKNAELLLGEESRQHKERMTDDPSSDNPTVIEAGYSRKYHRKTPENVLDYETNEGGDDTYSVCTYDESSEFTQQLQALKNALDERLAVELSSSKSSENSPTDSVMQSPGKIMDQRRKSLLRQGNVELIPHQDDHDDDDDVVVTMYGNKTAYTPSSDSEDVAGTSVKDRASLFEGKDSKKTEEAIGPEVGNYSYLEVHFTLIYMQRNYFLKYCYLWVVMMFQVLEITLRKKPEAGFGFTVAGGVNTGGCYIKQLVSDPAVSDGRLRPGDKILKVNGKDTTNMSHVEAVTLLRKVHDVANLQLLRYPSSFEIQERLNSSKIPAVQQPLKRPVDPAPNRTKPPSLKDVQQSVRELVKTLDTPKAIIKPYDYRGRTSDDVASSNVGSELESHSAQLDDDSHQERGVLTIELFKPDNSPTSLGISVIERNYNGERGIYVKRLKVGGTAHKDGRLQAGDRILQVNETPFDGVHQRKAVTILREAGERVVFKVIRLNATDDDISSLAEDALSLMERKKESTNAHRNQTNGTQEIRGNKWDPRNKRCKNFILINSFIADSGAGGRYKSPRTLDLDVPVLLTDDWLNDVPLLHMPQNQTKDHVPQLLQSLADLVEGGEPHEEFKNLHHLKEAGPCDVGKLRHNKSKNRYRNVLPYDQNRVVLLNSGNDYINASHISLKVGEATLKYIACQGPVSESVSDFWLMMWQEKTNVIVMLTQAFEAGKIKCHSYWPQSKQEILDVDNGRLRVQQIRSYQLQALEVVQMTIEEINTGAGREITLLQYTAWPDHGVPDTALPLLKLLQLIHLFEQGSAPVVHCSAGIGRTGTLIAIDAALAAIEHGDEFDLLGIVCNLRNQRHGMIQTTDQYLFCYTACMEALLSLEEDLSQ